MCNEIKIFIQLETKSKFHYLIDTTYRILKFQVHKFAGKSKPSDGL